MRAFDTEKLRTCLNEYYACNKNECSYIMYLSSEIHSHLKNGSEGNVLKLQFGHKVTRPVSLLFFVYSAHI